MNFNKSDISILKRPLHNSTANYKSYIKKSNKGNIIKFTQERYLRDDIPSGSLDDDLNPGQNPILSKSGITTSSLFNKPHYLLPDTNVLLSQLDLLDLGGFKDVIILQTVLNEVKHRSLPLYSRLLSIINDHDNRFYVFYNEFFSETSNLNSSFSSPNDINDQSIRIAAAWYNNYLQHKDVILLSNDNENLNLAKKDNIIASDILSYVKALPNSDQLIDLFSTTQSSISTSSSSNSVLYPDYFPHSSLQAGIKSGHLFQGQFQANPFNYLEGSVKIPKFTKPVLLIGRQSINRAVQDDVVVVQLLPKSQWKASADQIIDPDNALKFDDVDQDLDPTTVEFESKLQSDQINSSIDQANSFHSDIQPTGRVVGIVKRQWRSYVCHLDKSTVNNSSVQSQQSVFVSPIDRRIPKIKIRTRQAANLVDQKILVAIDQWSILSRYPQGHFIRALGKVQSKEAEIESLLLEYEVPYRSFSKSILNCLPKEGESWVVPPKDSNDPVWKNRVDLRDEIVCSIDPPGESLDYLESFISLTLSFNAGCTDIDDALHAKYLPNGNIEAGVHIADVSHFVKPDNTMDLEAASRGTTVYLVDKRIDMLPSLLGTNLCSLRPNVERLAFSVTWELNQNAEIVNVKFNKSVIASKAAFTYEEAQLRKDDKSLNDSLTVSIRLLNDIAIKLKKQRIDRGALDLASPEVKIHLDSSESSEPIDVEQKQVKETNKLVEEFMLLANCSVAAKINETFPGTAVLRRHLPPPKQNFEALQDILSKRKGINLDVSSSGALARSLDNCIDKDEKSFNTLVRIMATRCMLSAEYFCSGSHSKETFSHYGLAAPIYTHFTSPIRRYADVLAHRQLASAINHTPLHGSLHNKSFVEGIMENINKRHRLGQQAGRASIEFYVALAIKARNDRKGECVREKAHVIRTFRNGLAVYVPNLGLEGIITFKKAINFIAEEYKIVVEDSQSKSHTISLFDLVDVEIFVENDRNTQRGKVRMVLRSPLDSESL
ncbi:hypothetical protein E3P92_02083 [Wallemia ichthyophaga]|uniref:Ribosomal RNA-processing protein 44 n=1 Tax=Wallemia ichthyophaga TaxID=245174 RepID=A0A4T0FSK0_WALIC|nr:hypothetical protein E3P98_01795 [Wallemia ichthyophaga]TIA91005.1 hypothetical protein E3P97_02193 [Wallemia ichthyophaga]TIB00014.1 hypothetical protein E3P95_01819 [Wallemia ichthyophaga]TIB01295.1 hypothetical protein E3P94_01851 [Wallemia ichthyophaga]TIB01699.1 hypothetical protein E3P96_02315 [Wallemia ichthyophaga]